jgi:hypothetical protein
MGITTASVKSLNSLDPFLVTVTVVLNRWKHYACFKMAEIGVCVRNEQLMSEGEGEKRTFIHKHVLTVYSKATVDLILFRDE